MPFHPARGEARGQKSNELLEQATIECNPLPHRLHLRCCPRHVGLFNNGPHTLAFTKPQNQPHQLLIRHSEIENGNARLKKEIDHLRKERTTANEVHAQFEGSIHNIRGEISSLMAQASAINDHREELIKTKEVKLCRSERAGGHRGQT